MLYPSSTCAPDQRRAAFVAPSGAWTLVCSFFASPPRPFPPDQFSMLQPSTLLSSSTRSPRAPRVLALRAGSDLRRAVGVLAIDGAPSPCIACSFSPRAPCPGVDSLPASAVPSTFSASCRAGRTARRLARNSRRHSSSSPAQCRSGAARPPSQAGRLDHRCLSCALETMALRALPCRPHAFVPRT